MKAETPEAVRGRVVARGIGPASARYSVYSAADVATVSYHADPESAYAAAQAFLEQNRSRLRGKNVLVIDRDTNLTLLRIS